jgi:hypothetical protein
MAKSKTMGIWGFLAVAVLGALAAYFVMDRLRAAVAPPVDMSLKSVLARAEWAAVYRKSGKVEIPFATMGPGADENPQRFRLLMDATRLGVPAPEQKPDLIFNIRFTPRSGGHGRIAHFGYIVRTGALGRGDDWGIVSPAIQRWLAALDARNPAREYTIVDTPGGKVAAPVLPELKNKGE